MAKFFNNFRPTSQDLDDYQRIIEIFMKERMSSLSSEDSQKIYQIQIKNQMKKGNSFMENKKHKEAIEQFIGAN